MRRTKQEAAITRERLLAFALQVFSQHGYAAATLEQIARAAGVTRGAIYWHYGSKAELYNALLTEYSARGGEIVRQAVEAGGSLSAILRRVMVSLLEAVEDDPDLRRVMELSLLKTGQQPELEESRRRQLEAGRGLLAGITAAMQQGIASGELRPDLDPADLARAFIALQNGAVHLWLQDTSAFSLKASAPSLAEVFLRGVCAP